MDQHVGVPFGLGWIGRCGERVVSRCLQEACNGGVGECAEKKKRAARSGAGGEGESQAIAAEPNPPGSCAVTQGSRPGLLDAALRAPDGGCAPATQGSRPGLLDAALRAPERAGRATPASPPTRYPTAAAKAGVKASLHRPVRFKAAVKTSWTDRGRIKAVVKASWTDRGRFKAAVKVAWADRGASRLPSRLLGQTEDASRLPSRSLGQTGTLQGCRQGFLDRPRTLQGCRQGFLDRPRTLQGYRQGRLGRPGRFKAAVKASWTDRGRFKAAVKVAWADRDASRLPSSTLERAELLNCCRQGSSSTDNRFNGHHQGRCQPTIASTAAVKVSWTNQDLPKPVSKLEGRSGARRAASNSPGRKPWVTRPCAVRPCARAVAVDLFQIR